MTDLPPGKWSAILIGDHWPDEHDIMVVDLGREKRAAIRSGYIHLAEFLLSAQHGALAEQYGHTADDLGRSFTRGENHARKVAALNGIKEDAYRTAHDSVQSLRSDLTAIAAEGNNDIRQIETSKLPPEAITAQIVDAIQRYKSMATMAAAKCAGNILDAMQRILEQEEIGQSARQFAQDHGVDLSHMFQARSERDELEIQVRENLERSHSALGVTPGFGSRPDENHPLATERGATPVLNTHPMGITASFSSADEPRSPAPAIQSSSPIPSSPMGLTAGFSNAGSQAGPRFSPPSAPSAVSSPRAPSPMSGWTSSGPVMSSHEPGSAGMKIAAAGTLTPHISPTELAQSFNKGMESGAPISAAAHAVPSAPITSTEPQISHATQTIPSAAVNPQVHVADTPTPVHHTPPPDAPPPTPILAAPQPISPPTPPQPVGPLPTYGSDLRPPVSTAITPPAPPSTPLPPSGTPTSAPVTPSAGQSAPHQPAVVRQNTPPTPPHPPSTLGAQAVAATATGAAMGTASADATARKRLQRLVTAVARQQPRLAWAAGDHADNTTLLVTDLACGWIPPGIRLPSAISLLPPARRRGNLEALLGDASVTASYTPIHHLPDDGEPIPTSPRARSAPDVKELGWELNQATQWRDGLPRLAHTLAKAASAGTGVLDSELDLLHTHLTETSKRVLDSYPDNVDAHEVGNWQLLAAIDALVAGDKAGANYHIAWFLAAKTA
ncbi:MAG: DUF5631 domain-containing protein [Mycobacterium gordonae]|uniref:DUF5631 domain-containing protein n=1 Tax=Mycobacterium gordonae TaxID=1778 RepID=UPI000B023E07|nr:DUF5631 domain-containing protein [Mycobacterium gordonae]MBX9981624.1 DUF5631 domain-containing protein [Mycobacterium gordonae]